MRYILSIRGGGIRGIIPCSCLIKLEEQLGGLTRDHIQFCAGTSTGALIAAGVAAGIPARELLKIYTGHWAKILTPAGAAGEARRAADGFLFDPANLRDALAAVLGKHAAWTVNACPVRIMISATAMNGHNWFFVKDNERNAQTTGGVKLVDAAVAAACAPTYFDHWPVGGIQGETLRFFDGNVGGTANPAYQACVEAFEYDDFSPRSSRVVSLGSGFYPGSGEAPRGLSGTIGWVAGTLVDSPEDCVDDAVERQWPGLLRSFNPELSRRIDETDTEAIPELLAVGQAMAASMDWSQLVR
jgi:patatin-like phospholipase/acyl hydrolase